MNNDELQDALSDAVKITNSLISQATDPDTSRKLHCLREFLFDLWEAALRETFDETTQIYSDAITSLKASQKAAEDAQADISKIGEAIKKAAAAAKVLDKLINLGLNIAKFFP